MNDGVLVEHRVERLARLIVPPLVTGLVLAGVHVAALFDQPPGFSWLGTLLIVAQVYVIAEGIRWIARWLDRRLPWRDGRGLRVALQLAASLGFACGWLLLAYLPFKLYEIANGANDVLGWPHIVFTLLVGLLFGTALAALQLLFDFFGQWRESQLDAERQRQAALRAELDAIKAQVNPHFLFNGFNAVYGLIPEQPDAARSLLLELSDVFRYVLEHGQRDLVPLATELEFLQAYARVLHARHGDALRLAIGELGDTRTQALPPMSLQLLLENAVRHNRLDPDAPLQLRIERVDTTLRVSNAICPRHGDTRGTGSGLLQVQARYRLLGAAVVRIERIDGEFRVTLPLLPCAP